MPRVRVRQARRQEDHDRARYAIRQGFLVTVNDLVPSVFEDLLEAVLPHYHTAVTEDPWLASHPISAWPWDRADSDGYPASARARLALQKWANHHNLTHRADGPGNLTHVPGWVVGAAQGVLDLRCRLATAPVGAALGPEPWRPLSQSARYLGENDRRDLRWFVQWQVQKLTWNEVCRESGVAPKRMGMIRQAVERMPDRLDLTLRKGTNRPTARR